MNKTQSSDNSSFIGQLKTAIQDGIDYAQSQLRLIQVQIASLALSGVIFLVLVLLAGLSGIAAFVLLTVAFGIWLAHATGGAGWSLLIIGGVYALIAVALGGYAVRWLNNLKS